MVFVFLGSLNSSAAAAAHRAFFAVAAQRPKKTKTKTEPNSCSFLSVSIVCNDTDIVGIFINYVVLFEISSWYKAVVFSQDP